jgi:hypothetical protein
MLRYSGKTLPVVLPELLVTLAFPVVTPPLSGCPAMPNEQLLPELRLTGVVSVGVVSALVEVAAHSETPGALARLRKPNGEVAESAVSVSVEPGVPMLVARNGVSALGPDAVVVVAGMTRGKVEVGVAPMLRTRFAPLSLA